MYQFVIFLPMEIGHHYCTTESTYTAVPKPYFEMSDQKSQWQSTGKPTAGGHPSWKCLPEPMAVVWCWWKSKRVVGCSSQGTMTNTNWLWAPQLHQRCLDPLRPQGYRGTGIIDTRSVRPWRRWITGRQSVEMAFLPVLRPSVHLLLLSIHLSVVFHPCLISPSPPLLSRPISRRVVMICI